MKNPFMGIKMNVGNESSIDLLLRKTRISRREYRVLLIFLLSRAVEELEHICNNTGGLVEEDVMVDVEDDKPWLEDKVY